MIIVINNLTDIGWIALGIIAVIGCIYALIRYKPKDKDSDHNLFI